MQENTKIQENTKMQENEEYQYLQLIKDILEDGHKETTREMAQQFPFLEELCVSLLKTIKFLY